MKKQLVPALFFILLAGCIPSIYPIFTEKDLILDDKVVGNWEKPVSHETWKFEKIENEKAYQLAFTEHNKTAYFEAHLIQLDGQTIMDLFPTEDSHPESKANKNDVYIQGEENTLWDMHLYPVHTFSKVTFDGDHLVISLMNSETFEKAINDRSLKVQHEKGGNGLILTASTAELQSALKDYFKKPDVFGDPVVLDRK